LKGLYLERSQRRAREAEGEALIETKASLIKFAVYVLILTMESVQPPVAPVVPSPVPPSPKKSNSVVWILLFLVILLSAITAFFVYQNMQLRQQLVTVQPTPTLTPIATSDPTVDWSVYSGNRYSFKYDKSKFVVESFGEAQLSSITKIKLPDSFTSFMGYKPPRVKDAIKIGVPFVDTSGHSLPVDGEGIMQIWIFDNSNQLNIDQWYDKYIYYPIQWGHSIETALENERPKEGFIVDSTNGKQNYLDLMGTAKLSYLQKGDEMYLFYGQGIDFDNLNDVEKIPNDVSLILSTFKFTERLHS